MNTPEKLNYSFDDYKHGMPPRAFGSETEYTADHRSLLSLITGATYSKDKPTQRMTLSDFTDPDVTLSRGRAATSSIVTTGGGELYVDVGMLEYATPECRTPAEMVLHERAGEQVVRQAYENLAAYEGDEVKVFKRSGYAKVEVDGDVIITEESVGNHENYTSNNIFGRNDWDQRISILNRSKEARCFADFLALRKIIDGVGMVDRTHFSISQKPRSIDFYSFDNVMGQGVKRPFFQHSSRLEVRSGEGNKSDWAKEFIVGLTSLVIRLIEHDAYPEKLMLFDANRAVETISRNPLAEVWLESNEKMKGIDVLKELVDTAVEIGLSSPDFPKYEQKAANDFYQFYDDLHDISLPDDDVRSLSDRIDWAARYQYLVRRGASFRTFTTMEAGQVRDDLRWDQLGEGDIARKWFHRLGRAALYVPMPQPPRTRAEARVNILKDAGEADIYSVSWYEISTSAGDYRLQGSLDYKSVSFQPRKAR